MDDEYFRLMVAFEEEAANHPAAKRIHPTILRSLRKPEKIRFRNGFLRRTHRVQVTTPAGLYLGRRTAYKVDLVRLTRVACRTTMGLFYKELGRRLPDSHGVAGASADGLLKGDQANEKLVTEMARFLISRGQPTVIGDGIFAYWFQRDQTDQHGTLWLLRFFEAVHFFCQTAPLETLRRSNLVNPYGSAARPGA